MNSIIQKISVLKNQRVVVVSMFVLGGLFVASCKEPGGGDSTAEPSLPLFPTADIVVEFNHSPTHIVSDRLMGFNSIYSHYTDSFWAETSIIPTLASLGVSNIRWPGGAPTNRYHWNDLNGQGWMDNWDPDYDHANDMPQSEFTDIVEYMEICRETGAVPLVGINMGSGLRYNRVEDGISEAVDLVTKYAEIDHYYLDNEPYHSGANYQMTWSEYSEQIQRYVPAILAANPNAKFYINWEKVRDETLWKLLAEVHHLVHYVDVHWYWNNTIATFDDWVDQIPMLSTTLWYSEGGSYHEEIEWFNDKCEELGYDIELSTLEWNIGGSSSAALSPTKYESSIMQSEMMMQFINGGLQVAVMWPIFWPDNNDPDYNPNRYLMDPSENYSLSPSVDIFDMFGDAKDQYRHLSTSTDKRIYALALSRSNTIDDVMLYAHSKSDSTHILLIKSTEYDNVRHDMFTFFDAERTTGGLVTTVGKSIYDSLQEGYVVELPPYSLLKLSLENNK